MVVCEICKSTEFDVIASEIREGPGIILLCRQCGLTLQDIRQTEQELEKYYNEVYQQTNSLRFGETQMPREHFQDSLSSAGPVFERVRPLLGPEKRILEIGCGSGALLSKIKPHVREAVGAELNKDFVSFIRNDLGITAYAQDVNTMDIPDGSFDIILCIMTLDHLPNPARTIATMKRLLKPDGTIYLEVPNRDDALNHYLPSPNQAKFNMFFWHKAHYFYFTRETLTRLLENEGLTPKIFCRHQYTLVNFLNWYFCGSPQKTFVEATCRSHLFKGNSDFEKKMNILFSDADNSFHKILEETFSGDTLCCIASHQKAFR
ncbi:MAG: class I SAM-dependent methyltransferase [Methanoregula sp.]|nr:class I SAM-dependent methyltransferase [Methanoregula sp.]